MNSDHEKHRSFIKTPKQLIIIVAFSFLVPIFGALLLAQLITTGTSDSPESSAMSEQAVAERLKPVGEVAVVDSNAPKVERSGEDIVKASCAACHATGALNAPKIGDKAAWAKRIANGLDALATNAIKGIRQMPARGGNPDLSDEDMRRAVIAMANQSGASFKEPAPKTAAGK